MLTQRTMRIAAVVVLFAVGGVQAGVLQSDANAYDDGSTTWQGVVEYRGLDPLGGLVWASDIEYIVYAPASYAGDSFAESWPGETDPSGGQHFIYAYQIFNDLDPYPTTPPGSLMIAEKDFVNKLTVGLNPPEEDEEVANAGYIANTGYDHLTLATSKPPTNSAINSSSVLWEFKGGVGANQVNYEDISDVIFFTSPHGPEMDSATLAGQVPDVQELPSPTPEPATLVLLAIAGVAVFSKARRRSSNSA